MTPRVTAPLLALMAAATPWTAHAEDVCTQIIIYAIKQICSPLPNGQSLCQPVALTGPAPACQFPQPAQFKPVPLAPPTLQFPPGIPMAAPTPFPPMPAQMPYMPSPTAAQPLSPFAVPPVSPFAAPPAAFAPPQAPVVRPVDAPPAPTPAAKVSPGTDSAARKENAAAPAVDQASPSVPPAPAAVAQPAPAPATSTASPALPSPPTPATPTAVMELPEAPMLPVLVAEALALFAFDSAELSSLGKETLDSWLATAPVGMPVVISGHADRLGPEPYNLELSLRRAMAARDYLVAKGKDARDIRIVAKGETEPVKQCRGGATDTTKACLAPNRRVLIAPE